MAKRLNPLRLSSIAIFYSILLIFALLTCIPNRNALALQPPDPDELAKLSASGELEERIAKAKEIGNHRVDNDLFHQAIRKTHREYLKSQGFTEAELDLLAPMPAPPLSWRGIPTTGNVKPLAILIEFQDYLHTNSRDNIHRDLFGAGLPSRIPYESLSNYYSRASYQQLNISGNTLGWYTTAYNRSSVPQTLAGRENLIKETLNYFNSQGHDFSQYDQDGDGVIDYLIVFWAGPDNGWANFWWGMYFFGFSDSTFRVDGKRIGRYSWQWEAKPVGSTFLPNVVIHETGHALGLPDYYDYDAGVGPDGGVGRWDMMDASSNDHNSFSKWLLDWITPRVVANGREVISLNASGTAQDSVLIWPGVDTGDLFSEFFMVQNRQPAGNDSNLQCGGIFTWHVDATLKGDGSNFLYDNSYTAHKLLRLMEADGFEEIEMGDGLGDCGDLYKSGNSFGPGTAPSSRRYSGASRSRNGWTTQAKSRPAGRPPRGDASRPADP